MTHSMHAHHNNRGFTLLETIIYIGLFGIMMSGIFVSIYPLLTGAERLTRGIVTEGEAAFILAKIEHALSDTITSTDGIISTPTEGTHADELRITYDGTDQYRFQIDTSNTFCSPPRVCSMLTLSQDGGDPLPLNAERVSIENFSVTHTIEGSLRYVDVTFTANGEVIGPVRYYLRF